MIVIGEGSITQAHRIEAINGWLRDPAFRPGLNTLCDFSVATSTPTMVELRGILSLVDRHAGQIGKKKPASGLRPLRVVPGPNSHFHR
jgi:hypothetical protein